MRAALPALLLLVLPLAGQGARTYTLPGESVAVYNIAGVIRVEGSRGGAVTVAVTPTGADAGRLSVETGELRGRNTLRVIYPGDRIVYPELGRGSNSNFTIRDDGTWGDDSHRWGRGDGRKVTIRGSGDGLEASADLTVNVPEGRRVAIYLGVGRIEATNVNGTVHLDAMSGDVSARGTRGSLSIDTGSGDVVVTGASGSLSLDTGSGDVDVSDMKEGDLKVDTGSGEVRVHGVTARSLDIDTGSGDIRVEAAQVPDAALEAGSGSIWISLEGAVDRLHAETGSGDVTVRLPESTSATVDLETGSGDLDIGIPLQLVRKSEGEIRGTLGEGRGRIEIETGSGDISLTR